MGYKLLRELTPPKNLRVQARSGTVQLDWDVLEAAISYTVFYSSHPEVFYSNQCVENIKDCNFTHENRAAGQTYYYRVAADSGKGLGPLSEEISIFVDISCWTTLDGREAGKNMNRTQITRAATPDQTSLNGSLYYAWTEKNSIGISQIRVAGYDSSQENSELIFLDGNSEDQGLNLDSENTAFFPSLAASPSGKLYVAWQEYNSKSRSQIRVAEYTEEQPENTGTWKFLDGGEALAGLNRESGNPAAHPHLHFHQGKLFCTWQERNPVGHSQIRIATYEGEYQGQPQWTFADGAAGFTGVNINSFSNAVSPRLISANDSLFAYWSEENTAGVLQIRLTEFNGDFELPEWRLQDKLGPIGLNKIHTDPARAPFAAYHSDSGNLFLTWSEGEAASQIRVIRKNLLSNTPWTFIENPDSPLPRFNMSNDPNIPPAHGLNFNPQDPGLNPQLTIFNDRLYAVWTENDNVRMKRYEIFGANNWSPLPGPEQMQLNEYPACNPQLILSDRLYSAWMENVSNKQARIRAMVAV